MRSKPRPFRGSTGWPAWRWQVADGGSGEALDAIADACQREGDRWGEALVALMDGTGCLRRGEVGHGVPRAGGAASSPIWARPCAKPWPSPTWPSSAHVAGDRRPGDPDGPARPDSGRHPRGARRSRGGSPGAGPGLRRRRRAGQSPGAARTARHLGLAPAAGASAAPARQPGRPATAGRRPAGPSSGRCRRPRDDATIGRLAMQVQGQGEAAAPRRCSCGSAASAASRWRSAATPSTSRPPSRWSGPCFICWRREPENRFTGRRSWKPSGPKPTLTPACTGSRWRSPRSAACWPSTRRSRAPMLAREGDSYRLALPDDADCDVWQFDAHLRRAATARSNGRRPRRGGRPGRGPGRVRRPAAAGRRSRRLGGRSPGRAPAGGRRRRRPIGAASASARGQHREATEAARVGLSLDRYRDELWQLLIEAADRSGHHAEAGQARRAYAAVLGELGV